MNDNLKFNQETEFVPILGQIAETFNDDKVKQTANASSIQDNHHPALLSLLAQEMNISPEEIHDFELYGPVSTPSPAPNNTCRHLYDTQPSCLIGVDNEFISSARMDNLVSS